MSSSTDTPRPKERKSGLQMKLELIVEVSIRNSLKVKRRTIVHTWELEKQVDDGKEDHETLVLPSCHVTTETNFESNTSNDEPNEVPQVIKDGG